MGRLNLGRRFLGLRPFSYTKVGLAELVNKPEAEFEVVNCWCAAIADLDRRQLNFRYRTESVDLPSLLIALTVLGDNTFLA